MRLFYKNMIRCITNLFQEYYVIKTIIIFGENYEYYKSLGVISMQQCIVRENVIDETNPYLVNNYEAVEKIKRRG